MKSEDFQRVFLLLVTNRLDETNKNRSRHVRSVSTRLDLVEHETRATLFEFSFHFVFDFRFEKQNEAKRNVFVKFFSSSRNLGQFSSVDRFRSRNSSSTGSNRSAVRSTNQFSFFSPKHEFIFLFSELRRFCVKSLNNIFLT